jgi:hypothetical protein
VSRQTGPVQLRSARPARIGTQVLASLLGSLSVVLLIALASCGDAGVGRTVEAGAWTHRAPAGDHPSSRMGGCVAFDPTAERMLLFGGYHYGAWNESATDFNDLWSHDAATNIWTLLNPVGDAPTAGPAVGVYDVAGKTFLIYQDDGGSSPPPGDSGRLWAYDAGPNSYRELHPTGDAPPALEGVSVAYDEDSERMLLFGGRCLSGQTGGPVYSNEVYAYSPASNTWAKLGAGGPRPQGRYVQAMAYDSRHHALLIFGGRFFASFEPGTQVTQYDDVWQFNVDSGTWKELTSAEPFPLTYAPVAAYDVETGKTVVQVEMERNGRRESILETYDPSRGTLTECSVAGASPSPRQSPALMYDPELQALLMWGGVEVADGKFSTNESASPYTYFDDVWIYAPATPGG